MRYRLTIVMTILECTESGFEVEVPKVFGHYRYVQTIGQGATSVVCLVEHTKTHEQFAAKFVSRNMFESDVKLMYFERELRVSQALHHPNIVGTRDIVYLPKSIGIILEYCSQGDLIDYFNGSRYHPPSLIRSIFYQLVRAIAYLHSKGYGHRDLKPENIFITQDLHIKVGDLGMVKEATAPDDLTNTICGTLYYTAPEILAGESYDPMKADIWSLGVILYALTTKQLPWSATDTYGIQEEIKRGEVMIPDSLALPVADVLHACLIREPEKRATAGELLELPWMLVEQPNYERVFLKKEFVPRIRDCRTNPTLSFGRMSKVFSSKQLLKQPIKPARSEKIMRGNMFASQTRFVFKDTL